MHAGGEKISMAEPGKPLEPLATPSDGSEPMGAPVTSLRRAILLAVCVAIGTVNIMDRQLLSIANEALKADLALTDTQLGLLAGAAFAIFYACFGLPLAYLADRYDRPKLIAGAMAFWSLLTALTGAASSFAHLALCRIGVASGEAAASPTMYSLIGDLFDEVKRPFALAVAGLGSPLGTFLALWIGGYIVEHWGWRIAFVVFGALGVAVALLVLIALPEPRRSRPKLRNTNPPMLHQLRDLLAIRSYRWLLCGTLFGSIAMYACIWMPSYFQRVHGWTPATTGLWLGTMLAATGVVGGLASGAAAGEWTKSDRSAPAKLCALLLAVSVPFMIFTLLTGGAMAALLLFIIPAIGLQAFSVPFHAAQQNLAPSNARALVTSIGVIVINLGGLTFGAGLVGILSDYLLAEGVENSLQYALILVPVTSAIGALAFWRSANCDRMLPS